MLGLRLLLVKYTPARYPWYCTNVPVPVIVIVGATYTALKAVGSVHENETTSVASKLPVISTVALETTVPSTSEIVLEDASWTATPFSVHVTEGNSRISVGASFTAVTTIVRVALADPRAPSFMRNDSVFESLVGFSVFST